MAMRGPLTALLAAVFALVAACSDRHDFPAGAPAMWEVTGAEGQHGYLFGTVHALPDGVEWRTQLFDEIYASSQMLVVEARPAAGSEQQAYFRQLYTTPGLPSPLDRVAPDKREDLAEALEATGLSDGDLRNMESWAVALAISSAAQIGESSNGVERVLLADATDKQIEELEGYAPQLEIFDSLPEQDQIDLLGFAATDLDDARETGRYLIERWLLGDLAAFEEQFETGMLADEGLYEALLARRNRAWVDKIEPYLAASPPFIAVGAAHMIGPDGLPALLEARGYTVTRIQ